MKKKRKKRKTKKRNTNKKNKKIWKIIRSRRRRQRRRGKRGSLGELRTVRRGFNGWMDHALNKPLEGSPLQTTRNDTREGVADCFAWDQTVSGRAVQQCLWGFHRLRGLLCFMCDKNLLEGSMPASFAMLQQMRFLGVGGEPQRPGPDACADGIGQWSANLFSISDAFFPL